MTAALLAALALALTMLVPGTDLFAEQRAQQELRNRLLNEIPQHRVADHFETPQNQRYLLSRISVPETTSVTSRSFHSLNEQMIFHIFRDEAQESPPATVFLVHGFLAHVHDIGTYITALLSRGYVVVVPELPGHGLSGGQPAGIPDFAHYGEFMADLLELFMQDEDKLSQPWHAVGHSTGATAIWEFLRLNPDPFDRVVYIAPLVRSAFYHWSRLLRTISRPFAETIPTRTNHELLPPRMPMSWFDAQVQWNSEPETFESLSRPILVIQGNRDSVVAWRHNRRRLQAVYENMQYVLIPGGGHVLHGNDPVIRRQTMEHMLQHLESPR